MNERQKTDAGLLRWFVDRVSWALNMIYILKNSVCLRFTYDIIIFTNSVTAMLHSPRFKPGPFCFLTGNANIHPPKQRSNGNDQWHQRFVIGLLSLITSPTSCHVMSCHVTSLHRHHVITTSTRDDCWLQRLVTSCMHLSL